MTSEAELRDQKTESNTARSVRYSYRMRLVTMIIGFVLSITLIVFGYLLTQQELSQSAIKQASQMDSEIRVDLETKTFVLKNTAPGLVLIICGTLIAIATIRKETWVKSQWSINEKGIPGFTESKG